MLYEITHLSSNANVLRSSNDRSEIVCPPPLSIGDEGTDHFVSSTVPHKYSRLHCAWSPFVAEVEKASAVTCQSLVFNKQFFFLDSYHNAELVGTILPIYPFVGRMEHGRVSANLEGISWSHLDVAAIIASPHLGNYHHWMLETLPRLWFLGEYPEYKKVPILLPKIPKGGFQESTLMKVLKKEQSVIWMDGFAHKFNRLVFPSFLAPCGHSKRQVNWIRGKLMEKEGVPSRLLYISRRDAINGRGLKNEGEIEEYLHSIGFETLVLGEMKHEDQVSAFSNARVIVGVSGSGIVNHIFAKPGKAHVIEFHPEEYTNRAHYFTSSVMEHTYQFVIGPSDQHGNLEVPLERVKRAVCRVL